MKKNCFSENFPNTDSEVFSLGQQLTLESDDDSALPTAGGESDQMAHVDVNDNSQGTGGDQSDRWGDSLLFTLDNTASGWFTK